MKQSTCSSRPRPARLVLSAAPPITLDEAKWTLNVPRAAGDDYTDYTEEEERTCVFSGV